MKKFPLQLDLASFGRASSKWTRFAFDDYSKRISSRLKFRAMELRESRASSSEARLREEAELFRRGLKPTSFTVLLGEEGCRMNSRTFASWFEKRAETGTPLVFLLGSADGLDPFLKKEGNMVLSLGEMTMPHELARVVLVEQIYRALTIIEGHPYHRD